MKGERNDTETYEKDSVAKAGGLAGKAEQGQGRTERTGHVGLYYSIRAAPRIWVEEQRHPQTSLGQLAISLGERGEPISSSHNIHLIALQSQTEKLIEYWGKKPKKMAL